MNFKFRIYFNICIKSKNIKNLFKNINIFNNNAIKIFLNFIL